MIRIVILGGGFGGIRCALDCASRFKDEASVTLIDRSSYHSFTPALYEIASAYQPTEDPFALKLRRAVAIPYKDIFEKAKINFIQAEVASVDLTASHAVLDGGSSIDFDYAVFALGSQMADFGIPGVNEYSYQFKTTDDAVALHSKLENLFQEAVKGKVNLPIKFLIIGAGFTGIELAAELMTCARKMATHYGLNNRSFSAVLFEAGPTILPMVKEKDRKKIMKRLTDVGVVVMTSSVIENVLTDSVKLKSGHTVTGSAVVWTAGVRPNKLAQSITGLSVTDKGRIVVDENLKVEKSTNLFAMGDCVEFIDSRTQKPIPGLAYLAQAQGGIVARNLYRLINKKKLDKYYPSYDYWVAPVGGKFAVAHLSGLGTYSGVAGWLIRAFIDLKYFLSILPFPKAFKLFGKDLILFSKND